MTDPVLCDHCGKRVKQSAQAINRAKSIGAHIYCDRRCAGYGRRRGKTVAQMRLEKKLYDEAYRAKNATKLKAQKAERHRQTYDPKKAAKERKKRMAFHVEYCRQPAYKEWKSEYDRHYRARQYYGEWAEVALLVEDLDREIASRASKYDIYMETGQLNKAQKRRRGNGY